MLPPVPIVFVVDDDISVRESLELLIRHAGWGQRYLRPGRNFLPAHAFSLLAA